MPFGVSHKAWSQPRVKTLTVGEVIRQRAQRGAAVSLGGVGVGDVQRAVFAVLAVTDEDGALDKVDIGEVQGAELGRAELGDEASLHVLTWFEANWLGAVQTVAAVAQVVSAALIVFLTRRLATDRRLRKERRGSGR